MSNVVMIDRYDDVGIDEWIHELFFESQMKKDSLLCVIVLDLNLQHQERFPNLNLLSLK